jgi:biotin synthase
LFGLGETWEDRWQLALTLKELEVDSVPINFFNAIQGTPLAGREPLSVDEALRIVALFRLMLPKATIRICGGRPAIFSGQDELLFRAGTNALMTGNYLTTSGISPERDRQMIEHTGHRVTVSPIAVSFPEKTKSEQTKSFDKTVNLN